MLPVIALASLALQSQHAFSLSHFDEQIPLGGGQKSPFTSCFDELVSRNLGHWHVPGISITVVDGDETFSKVCPVLWSSICHFA